MSETLKELRALPLEDLIRRHDDTAQHTQVGVLFYLEEIARRDAASQVAAMLGLTRWIAVMTGVVTVSTIVNLLVELLRRL